MHKKGVNPGELFWEKPLISMQGAEKSPLALLGSEQ